MEFVPKFGVLRRLMANVIKPIMKRRVGKVFKGLDDHIRIGKIVGKSGVVLESDTASAA